MFFSYLGFIASIFFSISTNSQIVANFENINLMPNSYWNGSDNSGGFYSGGFYFPNNYTDYGGGLYAWYGFACSNVIDTSTMGYTNQFAAITGKGALNSSNYAISYVNYDWMNNYTMTPNYVRFSFPSIISGFYVTNSTYAYYSMLYGDGSLAKKFGGLSGNDPDWFKLQIKGYHNGLVKDSIDFYLADYRFTNNVLDYIVKEWKWVDLSSMGLLDSISLGLTSSDVGAYGMNTPSYFCLDELNSNSLNINENNSLVANDIVLYPLPANDFLFFKSEIGVIEKVKIFNLSGSFIMETYMNNNIGSIDLSYLTSGVYILEINSNNNKIHKKIVKN